jgi:hypothetical protein
MTRTSRFSSLLSIVAAGLIFSSTLAVGPGEVVDLKADGTVSPCLTDASFTGEPPVGVAAEAACDEVAGALQANSSLPGQIETAIGAAAVAAVLYEFTVDGDEGTEGNPIEGMLAYAMSWRGVGVLTGVGPDEGENNVAINLDVEDVTDSSSPVMVAGIEVHRRSNSSGVDADSAGDVLALQLVRGHSYLVTASLATSAATKSTTAATTSVADYLNDVESDAGGAWVDVLALEIGVDLDELAEQVAANTEAIEDLTEAMEALTAVVALNTLAIVENSEAIGDLVAVVAILADEVEAIKAALEELGDELANHTHAYLTGRGNGHNNTVAVTGKPVGGEEDAEIQPVVTNRSRSKKFVR